MKKAIKEGLIKPATIGREKVEVSILQYVDDTMFVVEGSVENAEALKWMLKNFEVMSGLKVNFHKSYVYGLNMDENGLLEVAGLLRCRVGAFPLSYLGLRVGGRILGTDAWKNAEEKIMGRLIKWESLHLSMGGRVTVVKSILTSIPLYTLSHLRLPKRMEKKFQSLQGQFLWGGKAGESKIAWVGWDQICKPTKEGGLGVKT